MLVLILLLIFTITILLLRRVLKAKHMDVWFFSYILTVFKRPQVAKTKHIIFCFVDHFEPKWRTDDIEIERSRVDRWCEQYPQMASKHKDANGIAPQHTFFFPIEEYREEHLDKLASLCQQGFGEIEVHLHHQNDNEENFCKTMLEFTKTLHVRHGALPKDPDTGQIKYAFIHGNWALDNSLPGGEWCGLNNELSLLKETGCYVDMTLPAAPSPAQTRKVNSIYYAQGKEGSCKNHNDGINVEVNRPESDGLMLIQGPLGVNIKHRNRYGMPHIETSDVRQQMPPTTDRIDHWVKSHIHVQGKPDWIFIKIHTHGAQEQDMGTLLGEPRDNMHTYLEQKYNDGQDYVLHYVSAREMYNMVKAAEANESGDPHLYRDYILAKPSFIGSKD